MLNQPEMDVEDVSWVDREDSDGETQVKVKKISLRRGVAEVCARAMVFTLADVIVKA
jgi:hypothetical protein